MRNLFLAFLFALSFGATADAQSPLTTLGVGVGHVASGGACATGTPKFYTTTGAGTINLATDFPSCTVFTVETIGGGGGGSNAAGQGGAGGSAYAKSTGQSLSGTIGMSVGVAGTSGVNGGNTWVCNTTTNCASLLGTAVIVGSDGGKTNTGATPGVGGLAINSIGATTFNGGVGGATAAASGGGGGSAGPLGAGGTGGAGTGTGGGGGGGNGGGSAGVGGNGGNNFGGSGGGLGSTGAGVACTAGTNGGGGGGGQNVDATAMPGCIGGTGTEWDATHGSGGGGGADTGTAQLGFGANYGGGGGSRGGAHGGQGIIVITPTA